jgi:Predicted membrane protein
MPKPKLNLYIFLWIVIILGVALRFFHLDYKLYWHDEVYTTLRSAGYLSLEVGQEIFSDRLFSAQELLQYQTIKPQSSAWDTIISLATEDPQHPPLYFLVNRLWMQIFGSSIWAMRLLPALIGVAGLPLMYLLAANLFNCQLCAWLATAFLAISPFDILFSQIARQYSLLTVCTIASCLFLLKAMQPPNRQNWQWLVYVICLTIGLYTHPFFAFTIIAHGVYVLILHFRDQQKGYLPYYLGANLIAIILYSPWLWIIINNLGRALATTNWAGGVSDWLFVPRLWVLSFTCLFLDLDVGFDNPLTYILRLPFLIALWWGVRSLIRHTEQKTWLFVVTNFVVPFLMLVIPDMLLGGRRSAVTRYLIPCFPAIQLAVAYLFSQALQHYQFWARFVLAMFFSASIASCTVSAFSHTWWSNVPSYFNAEVANKIKTTANSILISDAGNSGTNFGDLLSLAHLLPPNYPIYLSRTFPEINSYQIINQPAIANSAYKFVFRPSGELRRYFQMLNRELIYVTGGGDLWQVPE